MFGTYAEAGTLSLSPKPSSPHSKPPLRPIFMNHDVYIKFTHVCFNFGLVWLKSVFKLLFLVRDVAASGTSSLVRPEPCSPCPRPPLSPAFTNHDASKYLRHVCYKVGLVYGGKVHVVVGWFMCWWDGSCVGGGRMVEVVLGWLTTSFSRQAYSCYNHDATVQRHVQSISVCHLVST